MLLLLKDLALLHPLWCGFLRRNSYLSGWFEICFAHVWKFLLSGKSDHEWWGNKLLCHPFIYIQDMFHFGLLARYCPLFSGKCQETNSNQMASLRTRNDRFSLKAVLGKSSGFISSWWKPFAKAKAVNYSNLPNWSNKS